MCYVVCCEVCVMWYVLSVAWCVLCVAWCGVCCLLRVVCCVLRGVCCVVCVGVVGRPVVEIARGFNPLKFIINSIVIVVVVSFLVSRRRASYIL